MKIGLKCIALVCLLAGLGGVVCAQSENDDALSVKVDEAVRAQMSAQKIPGVSLAVMRDGKIVKAAGYGLANVELGVPVTPQSIFTTCSVGKAFTASAIMILVENGKLFTDDKIGKYVPDAPATWKDVTIRHLLTHTSGVADYVGEYTGKPLVDLHKDYTEDELFRIIAAQPLDFPPGEKRAYSNSGYVILGLLIHRVTGQFWFDFVNERIFKPLGMTSTTLMSSHDIVPNRVSGYHLIEGRWMNQGWVAPSLNTTADGTIYTSVLDMAKWDAALYTEKLLKRKTLEEMWTPVKLNNGTTYPNGFAWLNAEVNGHRLIWHDGYWDGFSTDMSRYVDDRLTVVVFTNLDAGEKQTPLAVRIAERVAALYIPSLEMGQLRKIASDAPKLNLPGPRVQELMLGNWSIKAHATEAEKNLGDGIGTELWYAGPGGNSIIEELHAKDPQGRPIDAFGPGWWDEHAGGQRFIWCTNTIAEGCAISANVIRWDGDRTVYREDEQGNGKTITSQEVFSDITPNSFTQTISEGSVGKDLIPTWTARATRLATEVPRMVFPAAPIAGEQDHKPMEKLINAFAGSWSIHLSFTPNKQMPNGSGGEGEEIWRAGPGGYSLIEEYHSIGVDGDVSGLGIFWPNTKAQGFRLLWCDNTTSPGCHALNNNAEWKEGQLSLSEERIEGGKKRVFREVFAFDTPNVFTQTLAEGDSVVQLKPFLTIRATRKTSNSVTTHDSDLPLLTSEQQEVLQVSRAWLDAYNRRDLDTFSRCMSDDFTAATDEGDLLTKTEMIQYLSVRPPEQVQKRDAHEFQIHVEGNTAIVNYLVTSLNTWGDTTIVFHRRRSEVFKKIDGTWLAIAAHESLVPVNFRKPAKADAKTLEDYVGEYDWPRHVARDIDKYTIEGGHLMSEWRGTKRECLPIGKDTFFARDDIGSWTFTRDTHGRVTGYVYSYPDGQEIAIKKIR